jgi:glyoxylase-like metal-dependent hydrolase (beta-lactamase superfamily II)
VIVERAEHPSWLSNAYLVAEESGGSGVLVDGNGVVQPLLERVERDEITITHVLVTHGHADHVVGLDELARRFGAEILSSRELSDGDSTRSGGLEIEAIHTPGHDPDHLSFLVDGTDCLTGDVVFRRTVGGTRGGGPTGFADLKHSIMERLLTLPPETRIHPGHREATTVGEEWEENPFVRLWRGLDEEGNERCRVGGRDAQLVLWADDYDGGHKAWVRFDDGEDAIVGGSQVER